MHCRLCNSNRLLSVLDLGATPPCEKFLTADELDCLEPTYPLHLWLCENCLLLQVPALIAPEDTFTEYAYYSSYSDPRVEHERVEHSASRLGMGESSIVVEVAGDDGHLHQHIVGAGILCLGIEPLVHVGAAVRDPGVPTRTAFLDEDLAASARAVYGPADLVVTGNVFAHVPDLIGFTQALRTLMADDGWLSIEVHHALNLIQFGQFDAIRHGRFQYYTVLSAARALATAGLAVVDVESPIILDGSIRIWARPDAVGDAPSPRVREVLLAEEQAGLHNVDGYLQLAGLARRVRLELLHFLLDCQEQGKSAVGYGAPSDCNTLLNYCGIRPDLLEYTVDRNPEPPPVSWTPGYWAGGLRERSARWVVQASDIRRSSGPMRSHWSDRRQDAASPR